MRRGVLPACLIFCFSMIQAQVRPRARDLGIRPGKLDPGRWNGITDVPGVRVGHLTIINGSEVRTGVTVVLPHGGNLFQEKVRAAIHVGNGFGKLIGSTQLAELGVIESPIALTNTLSVWRAAESLARYMLALPGNELVRSVNVIVGETNDGGLNDIRGMHVQNNHVVAAIHQAVNGPVTEGAVGAGTGTQAFGFKGGIGTASRLVKSFILGVLVQSNFGGDLTIDGVPVWKEIPKPERRSGDGSVMIVVATNAPLDARQLRRIASRSMLGIGRTGSVAAHGSGDYVIAFSTHRGPPAVSEDELTPFFEAVVESTEEAVYNSLLKAETMTGKGGRTVRALPVDELRRIFEKYGRSLK